MCVWGGVFLRCFTNILKHAILSPNNVALSPNRWGGNYFVKNASIVRAWVLRVNMCLCLFMCLGVGVYVRVFVCAFVRL